MLTRKNPDASGCPCHQQPGGKLGVPAGSVFCPQQHLQGGIRFPLILVVLPAGLMLRHGTGQPEKGTQLNTPTRLRVGDAPCRRGRETKGTWLQKSSWAGGEGTRPASVTEPVQSDSSGCAAADGGALRAGQAETTAGGLFLRPRPWVH